MGSSSKHSAFSSENTARNVSNVKVVFGFRTALQMHRSMHDPRMRALCDATAPLKLLEQPAFGLSTCSASIPQAAPSDAELKNMLERMRERNPHLAFDRPVHLLVKSGRKHPTPRAAFHSCASKIPSRALLRLDEKIAIASPNLALCQIASTQMDFVSLLLVLWEACGTYCTGRTGVHSGGSGLFDTKPLTNTRSLKAFCSKNSHLRGSLKIARCLRYVADGSASPRETELALYFGLPERYGGWNLGIPRMNEKVIASEKAFAIAGRRSFRCDLCWREARLDVEYQSKQEHQGEAMRISDSRRANALAAMGWTVIGITNNEASSLSALGTIANAIRKQLGKRARRNVGNLGDRRLELCRKLGLIPFW